MQNTLPTYNLLGINYTASDYENISNAIIDHASQRQSIGLSALAVHGLIEAYEKPALHELIQSIHYVVPDGQPIKWCLNYFNQANLKDRVYGPTLTWKVLEKANEEKLSLYLYGSTANTLSLFQQNIIQHFPQIKLVGHHVDRFRNATKEEDEADIQKINQSEAQLILVGRGCPRQEIWVAEHIGKINGVMLAVGAAFDFHANTLKQAPKWMQNNGLEWLFRLVQEPRRLWKRYLLTNSKFIFLILLKIFKLHT
jgi:N-acetylglucosaminyldiphosphoundecaprenol N-acetyl-beta-D-mannosaminyltransferase